MNSCLTLAVMTAGKEVTTIEGIGQPGNLHAMQAAFIEHDGYQCGYCTSGQIMSAVALLKEPIGPTDEDVKQGMAGNICGVVRIRILWRRCSRCGDVGLGLEFWFPPTSAGKRRRQIWGTQGFLVWGTPEGFAELSTDIG